ncbi:hypothetical protein Tco_0767726 [Tanacetum coccineum]
MSCSNHHPNLTRKPRMSVRQVWKRKTPLPKSSPTRHNNSTPPPSRNTTHSISPPMNYPQRDQIIHQLYTVSSLIDSQTSTPSSPPHPMVQPPTNAQVGVMLTASLVNHDAVSTVCENEIFVFDEKFPALDSVGNTQQAENRVLQRLHHFQGDRVYVLGDEEFGFFPYQYFLRGSADRELLVKLEHFIPSYPVDFLALLEDDVLESFHPFVFELKKPPVRCFRDALRRGNGFDWFDEFFGFIPTFMVVEGEVLNNFLRFVSILVAEFATGGAVNLALKMKGDMIIKNLDLQLTINAMMREFLEISLRSFAVLSDGKNWARNRVVKILPCRMDPLERRSANC